MHDAEVHFSVYYFWGGHSNEFSQNFVTVLKIR